MIESHHTLTARIAMLLSNTIRSLENELPVNVRSETEATDCPMAEVPSMNEMFAQDTFLCMK